MPKIKKIDHIAIVVEDIDAALGFWRDALGLELARMEDVPEQKSQVAFLPAGGSEVELVKPTTDNSGWRNTCKTRGPGMHHICLEVDDIDGRAGADEREGCAPDQRDAHTGSGRQAIAFIHPESTNGVLVELYQSSGEPKK